MRVQVAVGMSGGVDSSVAAALLKRQGYDVTGVFIEAYNEPGCRTDQDKKDALQVALKLGIPFQVIDVRQEYKEKVVSYFFDEYKAGRTPNPDVVCNREVKFGIFYHWAMKQGFQAIATGHYARQSQVVSLSSTTLIARARDQAKDQSYFLWQVTGSYLDHILFPLGEMEKKEVRKIAHELGLPNADKPDSMGICMMGELNIKNFLLEKLGENPGKIVYKDSVVGEHKGLWFHTVGQRGGLVLDKNTLRDLGLTPEHMGPLYVVGKNKETNTIEVGTRDQAMSHLVRLDDCQLFVDRHWIDTLTSNNQLFLRIRNLGELNLVKAITYVSQSCLAIEIHEDVFGVAEGQAGVLYARVGDAGDEVVVGGGTIGV